MGDELKITSTDRTFYIASLKYAPGLWKEFVLLGNCIREKTGAKVVYLLSDGYKWLVKELEDEHYFISSSKNYIEIALESVKYFCGTGKIISRLFANNPPSFVCVYNPHPMNFALLAKAYKYKPDGLRCIYLHEPARPGKSSYGLKGNLFFHLVDYTQKLAIKNTTDIILPSPYAEKLFKDQYTDYPGNTHYAPILIPDFPGIGSKRRYFSMVGRFNFAKRLDGLIDTANETKKMNENFEFQVITGSDLENIGYDTNKMENNGIRIIYKEHLSDDDISNGVMESHAVLCLQPMITQSGVVPVAFMNSTPVIVPPIPGFTQFVKDGVNGIVLPDNYSSRDIISAMRAVHANFSYLSANARQTFLDLFAEKNWGKYYSWIVKRSLNDNAS